MHATRLLITQCSIATNFLRELLQCLDTFDGFNLTFRRLSNIHCFAAGKKKKKKNRPQNGMPLPEQANVSRTPGQRQRQRQTNLDIHACSIEGLLISSVVRYPAHRKNFGGFSRRGRQTQKNRQKEERRKKKKTRSSKKEGKSGASASGAPHKHNLDTLRRECRDVYNFRPYYARILAFRTPTGAKLEEEKKGGERTRYSPLKRPSNFNGPSESTKLVRVLVRGAWTGRRKEEAASSFVPLHIGKTDYLNNTKNIFPLLPPILSQEMPATTPPNKTK